MNFIFSLSMLPWMSLGAAEEPIVTDRPDFTESSVVVPRRSIQIESGVTFERVGRRERTVTAPEVLVRFGLTDRVEFRLGLPNYNWIETPGSSRSEGLDDTYIGAKVQLGPTKDGIDLAVIPAVFVPTGRRGIRSESASPEIKFVYSVGLQRGCALSGMAYVSSVEDSGKRVTPFQHTVSLGIPIRERVGMFVEHVLDAQRGKTTAHLLHSGFTYQPRPNSQFDLHFGLGLNRAASDFFIGAGYAIRF